MGYSPGFFLNWTTRNFSISHQAGITNLVGDGEKSCLILADQITGDNALLGSRTYPYSNVPRSPAVTNCDCRGPESNFSFHAG